jgi:hypothetical protein
VLCPIRRRSSLCSAFSAVPCRRRREESQWGTGSGIGVLSPPPPPPAPHCHCWSPSSPPPPLPPALALSALAPRCGCSLLVWLLGCMYAWNNWDFACVSYFSYKMVIMPNALLIESMFKRYLFLKCENCLAISMLRLKFLPFGSLFLRMKICHFSFTLFMGLFAFGETIY